MESVKIGNREVEVKFSYNSMKYMTDLDISTFETMETKPFSIIPTIETLLFAGCNHNQKDRYGLESIQECIEKSMEDGTFGELMTLLMRKLEESSFFKSLQGMNEAK